jgi:hypothetical protein
MGVDDIAAGRQWQTKSHEKMEMDERGLMQSKNKQTTKKIVG